jgi:transposase
VCAFVTTRNAINAVFMVEQLEALSFDLQRQTVAMLDNVAARVAKRVQERRAFGQQRGLFVFYLPPYSPRLNIAEVLWRKLKYQWLRPQDHLESQTLFYQVHQALAAVGTRLKFTSHPFNII